MDISVDSGRNRYDTSVGAVCLEVLGKETSVSNRASGSDKNKTGQAEIRCDLKSLCLLLVSSKLVWTTANVVVSTKVAVESKVFTGHDLIFVVHKTVNTINEADKLDILALSLIPEQAINNVVTTRCLTAHVDKTDLLRA